MDSIEYGVGLRAGQREAAARLYDEAFGEKFKAAIRSREDRIALFAAAFCPDFAVTASVGGELVGLAGFQTPAGSLTGGIGARQLLSSLGAIRGVRAMAVFSLFERTPKSGELLMDGIAVDANYRGHGIGTRLLGSIISYARENRFSTVRLDVIDTNPGARRLYERRGFVPVRTERFPYLRWLVGFGAATTMEFRIEPNAS